jgi:hypothetical protein
MADTLSWKDKLADRIPQHLSEEIEIFETQIELKRQGKIADPVFAETESGSTGPVPNLFSIRTPTCSKVPTHSGMPPGCSGSKSPLAGSPPNNSK